MAISEKTKQLMEDPAFLAKLDQAEDIDAYKAVFAAEGIDFDAEFESGEDEATDVELTAEDLDNVAGGLSTNEIISIVKSSFRIVSSAKVNPLKTGWKFGASCGVLIRAYYDIKVYNNVFRSYSKKEIESAAKYLGLTL